LIALPRTSFGSSTVKARIVGRDLEQHAVRLSKIGRTETAAVDLLGRAEPLRLEHGDHFGLRRVVGRVERDVVDATAALAADGHIGGGAHVHDVPRSPPARARAGPPVTLVDARARAHHKFMIVPHRTPTGAGTSLCGGRGKRGQLRVTPPVFSALPQLRHIRAVSPPLLAGHG